MKVIIGDLEIHDVSFDELDILIRRYANPVFRVERPLGREMTQVDSVLRPETCADVLTKEVSP